MWAHAISTRCGAFITVNEQQRTQSAVDPDAGDRFGVIYVVSTYEHQCIREHLIHVCWVRRSLPAQPNFTEATLHTSPDAALLVNTQSYVNAVHKKQTEMQIQGAIKHRLRPVILTI